MEKVLEWLETYWGWLLPLLAACIRIKPMEVSPMVWLLRKIGNALTGDLRQQLAEMDGKIDRNEMDRIRWEVLDFANSCRNRKQHTKSEFEHIIDLNRKYELLLARTHETNGVFEEDYRYIHRVYSECQEQNKFIA